MCHRRESNPLTNSSVWRGCGGRSRPLLGVWGKPPITGLPEPSRLPLLIQQSNLGTCVNTVAHVLKPYPMSFIYCLPGSSSHLPTI
jgi:hypothetical protein